MQGYGCDQYWSDDDIPERIVVVLVVHDDAVTGYRGDGQGDAAIVWSRYDHRGSPAYDARAARTVGNGVDLSA